MTTLHDLPPLPDEMATSACVQGIQGSEYRLLSGSYEPGFAMYSERHMQSYARQAIDHHMAQLVARVGVMPVGSFHVSLFRNAPSMRNTEFQELADIPAGSHQLYDSEAIATLQAKIEQLDGALMMLRNNSSVSLHQIEIIDTARSKT